jgi:hypothetical protein
MMMPLKLYGPVSTMPSPISTTGDRRNEIVNKTWADMIQDRRLLSPQLTADIVLLTTLTRISVHGCFVPLFFIFS